MNDIKNSDENGYLKNRNLSEEKKNPPQAQIFRYFLIESRNNKIHITGKLIFEGCENGKPGNRRLNQKVSKLQHTACNV